MPLDSILQQFQSYLKVTSHNLATALWLAPGKGQPEFGKLINEHWMDLDGLGVFHW